MMRVSELIELLQTLPPEATFLTTWEGQVFTREPSDFELTTAGAAHRWPGEIGLSAGDPVVLMSDE